MGGIYVCELAFDERDPCDPGYSQQEVDIYAWVPREAEAAIGNHRLSIRKNLRTSEYEAYRHWLWEYHRGPEAERDEVAYKSKSLQDVLDFTNGEDKKYHGDNDPDRVCRHVHPEKSEFCRGPRTMAVGATPTTIKPKVVATCKRCLAEWEVTRIEGVFGSCWIPVDCPNPKCAEEEKGEGFSKVFGIEIAGFTIRTVESVGKLENGGN